MARNKMTDLNDHLFAQLERLGEEDLTDEQLKKEVDRSKAIIGVSNQIIEGAKVTLEFSKLISENMIDQNSVPVQFQLPKND